MLKPPESDIQTIQQKIKFILGETYLISNFYKKITSIKKYINNIKKGKRKQKRRRKKDKGNKNVTIRC